MRRKIIVVGSYNTDLRIKAGKIPNPGETVIDGIFSSGGGGKGANQAVAAVRTGADVSFIARVGSDVLGKEGLQRLADEGIDTRFITQDPKHATGVAFIVVDHRGENSIVVASGANALLSPHEIEKAQHEIASAKVLLVQLESPLVTVRSAIEIARRNDVLVILNPAPAQPLPNDLLGLVDIITPNIVEAEMLTGVKISDDESLRTIAQLFLDRGIKIVAITLGKKGIFLATKNAMESIPAFDVHAIDSTGAGDVFSGSLAAFIAEGMPIEEAARMAVASASISVTRIGALISGPHRTEIEKFISDNTRSESEILERQIHE